MAMDIDIKIFIIVQEISKQIIFNYNSNINLVTTINYFKRKEHIYISHKN